ncbi:MAG: Eco57I restriction-modification methylase domain-containing protein [Syntrophales bacterium]|jgi:hypothetical protein|nr:Eco57I restriction-modification methylase domain-containing protein [Syntrophales bacterium]
MNLSKDAFSAYIKAFRFKELFIDMGWNNDRIKQPIAVDESTFVLESVVEKSGFKILLCEPDAQGRIPDYAMRKKVEQSVTKLFQEHLIIYIDTAQTEQVWQLAVRQTGKPTKVTETRYKKEQSPELLYQRASGLFFTLDEEDRITIVDVTGRVAKNFQQNNEKVTKKFYEGFKKEHTAFLGFIKGIQAQGDREWYASLMLNRLMFCYFIQKKGFLDNNRNYLQDKLKACGEQKGKGKFYSFYRAFLLVLFHQGLGSPAHSKELTVEIGNVPYLNGGLFDEHELEKLNRDLDIDDTAFERLFAFFDEFNWYLDTRAESSGKDVNPDVIGYIFEKYINDRSQMGAYYTKEDITDYIGRNCIIPFLFDETKRSHPIGFKADGPVWSMVRESGNDYIYDAVKKGVPDTEKLFDDLPPEIKKGFDPELAERVVDGTGPYLCDLRKDWNKSAPSDIGLPTEIYRELIERRKRCADLSRKITDGDITNINDFITCNLNIRQFAQDLLENIADPDFIRHFYKALCKATILDPTCGSGAFLFAAMNILEPLYETCLLRMRAYVEDEDRANAVEKKTFGHKYKFFRETLAQVQNEQHPNQAYFIYKSIILNNLYGVDIMNEAVEIAKLRLFLKLAATVDADYRKPNLGLEPLPDVDFNIRVGNTLIGYATEAQIKEAFFGNKSSMLDFDDDVEKIEEKCGIVARAFTRYKEIQLTGSTVYGDFRTAKDNLNARLEKLTHALDVLLHKQHYAKVKFSDWRTTHRPFHWFAEFYEIVHGHGGFDVIIGNPPYVVYSEAKHGYKLIANNYKTFDSKNLFAYVFDRSFQIATNSANVSLIVQLTSITSENMASLQDMLIKRSSVIVASFPRRPESMFDGVEMPVAIILSIPTIKSGIFSSRICRFYTQERTHAIDCVQICEHNVHVNKHRIAKIGNNTALMIFRNVLKNSISLSDHISKYSTALVYYQEACRYWIKACSGYPYFKKNDQEIAPAHGRTISFRNEDKKSFAVNLLNSSLFYLFYSSLADCEHVNDSFVKWFPIPDSIGNTEWKDLEERLSYDLRTNSNRKKIVTKEGHVIEYDELNAMKSKPIIDEIDKLLAEHYGFTHEELDFIINYDIKYRMGLGKNGAEEERIDQ